MDLPYTIADSVFGSTFFIATGFHGLHVIIGTLILSTSSIRLQKINFRASHHLGFEASA
jgi:cytochrome c oxidase subunit 3